MKVLAYAVSVQWGAGMHYFKRTDFLSEAEASTFADEEQKRQKAFRKKIGRGATPYVHVWRLL
jgi:hypothetical protein